jgi:hypothetical protein
VDSRTAICRGAVYKGFLSAIAKSGQGRGNDQLRHKIEAPIAITSTISRSHLGVSYECEFQPAKHREENKYWSDIHMGYRATDQLDWYLGKVRIIRQYELKTKSIHSSGRATT